MNGLPVVIVLALLAACIIAQAFEPYFLACADDEDDRSNVDEHGWDRTPGEEPREVGLP